MPILGDLTWILQKEGISHNLLIEKNRVIIFEYALSDA